MGAIIVPTHEEARALLGRPDHWPEATIVARPVKKQLEPIVLVRRRLGDLAGAEGEEIVYVPGYPVISLFCGIGGFDIGLERAGFCTVLQHEWDSMACETLLANRPDFFRNAALIQGDICRTPTWLLLKEANLRVGECYVVTGGPPCQGFSTGNMHAVKHRPDARNDLVFEFIRVVREAQPKFFIFENVPGIMRFNKGSYMEAFLKAAWESGFELVYGLVDAVEYGVPQFRCRFICVGTRRDMHHCDGLLGGLPEPECFSQRDLDELKLREPGSLFHDESRIRLLTHPPGIRYFPDRPVLRPPAPNRGSEDGGRTDAFIRFFEKLYETEPDRIVRNPLRAA